jgi:hypothetical protein
MGTTLLTLLLIGCVTSSEVRQARVDHVSCLDRQFDDTQAAKSMSDSAAQTRAVAADCWRVFNSQVAAGISPEMTEVECRQLDEYAQLFDDRTKYYDARRTETAASCRAMGASAEELSAWLARRPIGQPGFGP